MNRLLILGATIVIEIFRIAYKKEVFDSLVNVAACLTQCAEDSLEARQSKRTLEEVADEIAFSCEKFFEQVSISNERKSTIIDLLNHTIKNSNITFDIIVECSFNVDLIYRKLRSNVDASEFDTTEKEVFDRVLMHASNIIINYIKTSPNFVANGVEKVITEISEIKESIKGILDKLVKVNNIVEAKDANIKNFERTYRNNVINKYDWVRLFGADSLDGLERPYKLSIAYVALEIANATKSNTTLEFNKLFKNNNVIWIEGEAGSGKTTFLQWLAVNIASNNDISIPSLKECIPILVQLRTLDCKNLSLKYIINSMMKDSSFEMPNSWLDELLINGKVVLLIDGVDEVKKDEISYVFEWIEGLYRNYNKIKIAITARPQIVDKVDIHLSHLKVLPMSQDKIVEFVKYWHKSVLSERLNKDDTEVQMHKTKLLLQIDKYHSIRRMATNPLLCAMLCALNYKNGSIVSKERNALYEDCCRMLLSKRDAEREIKSFSSIVFTYEEKKEILSQLAYWMMKNKYTVVDKELAKNCVSRTLSTLRNSYENNSEEVFNYFLERSGLLRSITNDEIDFIHKSFQEYLAAYAISKSEDWGFIVDQSSDIYWYETLVSSIGFAGEKRATKVINDIMEKDFNEKQIIIAAACANNATSLSDDLRTRISSNLSKLIPPKTNEDIKNLSSTEEFVVPFLQYNESYSQEENRNCLNVLRTINSTQSLIQAATFLNPSILEENLSQICNMLEQYSMVEIQESGIERKVFEYLKESCKSGVLKLPEIFLQILSKDSFNNLSNEFDKVAELTLVEYKNSVNPILFEKFASVSKINILGSFQNIDFLSKVNNISELKICDYSGQFDLYSLNKFENIKPIHFSIHTSNKTYISGSELYFLKDTKFLELYFYDESSEIIFDDFNKIHKLERLALFHPFSFEINYENLKYNKTLKILNIKMPENVKTNYYSQINVPDNIKYDLSNFDYPFGDLIDL